MSKAKELAKEIADELHNSGWIDKKWLSEASKRNLDRMLARIIAAKIEPLVSDAERWRTNLTKSIDQTL